MLSTIFSAYNDSNFTLLIINKYNHINLNISLHRITGDPCGCLNNKVWGNPFSTTKSPSHACAPSRMNSGDPNKPTLVPVRMGRAGQGCVPPSTRWAAFHLSLACRWFTKGLQKNISSSFRAWIGKYMNTLCALCIRREIPYHRLGFETVFFTGHIGSPSQVKSSCLMQKCIILRKKPPDQK